MHDSSKIQSVVSEPQDYAELKAERNELREAVKNFETELMQVCGNVLLNIMTFKEYYRYKWMPRILLVTGTISKFSMNRLVMLKQSIVHVTHFRLVRKLQDCGVS